jgi:hypothetical protein
VRLALVFVSDPVAKMREGSITLFFERTFGKLFTFEQMRTEKGVALVIPKCGYLDFFAREGEPQLTRAMCAWDRNWLSLLDGSNRPVATRSSLTLVTDGRPCEFHFDAAGAGPAPTRDVTL